MVSGKYGLSAGDDSSFRSDRYARANTMRKGLENEVAVYCIRGVIVGSPHPQVGERRTAARPIKRNASAPAAAITTTKATAWMVAPIFETLSKLPPGTMDSTTLHSGRINVIGIRPIKMHAAASTATGTSVAADCFGNASLSAVRGRPKNTTTYTLTKQAAT